MVNDSSAVVWGFSIPPAWLGEADASYLASLPRDLPPVEWVWHEMDRVWHQHGLDNRRCLRQQRVASFYSHPVWLMNGIFGAVDPTSVAHRRAIADYAYSYGARSIADYGGGFGELALALARFSDVKVSVVEPYPSRVGLERLRHLSSVKFVQNTEQGAYDAIIAQDVLEHVEDPIRLAHDIAGAVREGGLVITANCFHPVIQCHLPKTFHLRHTFPLVMKALGLRHIGFVDGATHAQVFVRTGPISLAKARSAERLSKVVGPCLNFSFKPLFLLKRLVLRR